MSGFQLAARTLTLLCLGFTVVSPAQAVVVSYTIDPQLSQFTTTGNLITTNRSDGSGVPSQTGTLGPYDGLPFSNVMQFQGAIVGDLNAGVLTFSAATGTLIDALPHPDIGNLPFDPGHDAFDMDRGEETNFGLLGRRSDNNDPFLMIAARDRQFDLTGGLVADGAAPSTLAITLLHGRNNYYNIPLDATSNGTAPNLEQALLDTSALPVGLTSDGVTETLSIPFIFTAHRLVGGFSVGTIVESTTIYTGQLVATRLVPEPSTLTLAGLGALAMLMLGRRRLASRAFA